MKPAPVIVTGVRPDPARPAAVARRFGELLRDGARFLPAGEAKQDHGLLLRPRYAPRHLIRLFDAAYYLTDFRYEEGLNFFVAYVVLRRSIYPRIFYKDSSLVWRVASHVIRDDGHDWIGKGDVLWIRDSEGEHLVSDEDTTNLPYEIQTALDEISRRGTARRDDRAVGLVLRHAPPERLWPYADFTRPRRLAAERHRLNGGRRVARLTRAGDPGSLRFARGFEPDFAAGLLDVERSVSRLYGGEVRKYRYGSRNRLVQYQLVVSPSHVWINPPQALTDELTTYGIRALHVPADDEIFLPGYEYHFRDDTLDPPQLHSQIPDGWAGAPSEVDPARADASRWIEALPVIREFRRVVLDPLNRPRARSRR